MKILLEDPSCPPKLPINFTYQSLMLQLNVLNVFMCLTALNDPYNDHYLNNDKQVILNDLEYSLRATYSI